MFLRTETISIKKTIGFSTQTSLANDKTVEIWQLLMPRLKEVSNAKNADLISLQVYDKSSLQEFTQETEFKKYALIEVKNYDIIPNDFEKFEIPAGKYAVFLHKGTSAEFYKTSNFIFGEWLPNSDYSLDDRPHFEILGDAYKGHTNPENEEEVWIPIQ
ncbi:GyrI-like domain-containing protein [Flavobacterium sp.]|uniref:GyrI-like domain-containing protein n=1 Tax=Flavobacterium sp. TaxID=239 RepID=UPI003F6A4AB2